jgi:hypothetical protein
MTAHCDDCREYESHIERMQESEDELACLLREAAEAEGWDTEKWCHWQSDARAALERAPKSAEAARARVVVELAGGVAHVYAERPESLDVAVVGHDVEGVELSELHVLAGEKVRLERGSPDRGPEFEALWEQIETATPAADVG